MLPWDRCSWSVLGAAVTVISLRQFVATPDVADDLGKLRLAL